MYTILAPLILASFTDDFSTLDTSRWGKHSAPSTMSEQAVIVPSSSSQTTPKSALKTALNTLSTNQGSRNEIQAINSADNFNVNSTYFIKVVFKIVRHDYHPVLNSSPYSWMSFFQTHSVPGPVGNPNWNNNSGRNPITIIETENNNIAVAVNTTPVVTGIAPGGALANIVWKMPMSAIPSESWMTWVIQLRPSFNADGIVNVWLNGVNIVSYTGQNLDRFDSAGVAANPFCYMKLGIYKEDNPSYLPGVDVRYDYVSVQQSQTLPSNFFTD
ncbi:MAG: hypothetical protein HOP02_15770 [Methylococcaceae bacterium]|nr:hypothetical protein [Methylococcaceae bacterium]